MGNFLKYALQKIQNDCININGLEPVGRGGLLTTVAQFANRKPPSPRWRRGGLELDVGLEPTTS